MERDADAAATHPPDLLKEAIGETRTWFETLPADLRHTAPGGLLWMLYVSDRKPTQEDLDFAVTLSVDVGGARAHREGILPNRRRISSR